MGNGLLATKPSLTKDPVDRERDRASPDMGGGQEDQGDDEQAEAQPDDEAAEGENGQSPTVQSKGGRKASPEEQKLLETFVALGLKIIYEPKGNTLNAIAKMLGGSGDWAHGLAMATAMLVSKVYLSAPQAIPASVVVQGGKELMTDIVSLAGPEHLKMHTYTPGEIHAATLQAAAMVVKILKQAGKLPGTGAAPAQNGEAPPAAAPEGAQEGETAEDGGAGADGAAAEEEDEGDQGPAPPFPKDLPKGPGRRG